MPKKLFAPAVAVPSPDSRIACARITDAGTRVALYELRAFGPAFRRYTLATMALLVGVGLLTGRSTARVEANLPTPWMGVWERIDIALFLIWIVALAAMLMREPKTLD